MVRYGTLALKWFLKCKTTSPRAKTRIYEVPSLMRSSLRFLGQVESINTVILVLKDSSSPTERSHFNLVADGPVYTLSVLRGDSEHLFTLVSKLLSTLQCRESHRDEFSTRERIRTRVAQLHSPQHTGRLDELFHRLQLGVTIRVVAREGLCPARTPGGAARLDSMLCWAPCEFDMHAFKRFRTCVKGGVRPRLFQQPVLRNREAVLSFLLNASIGANASATGPTRLSTVPFMGALPTLSKPTFQSCGQQGASSSRFSEAPHYQGSFPITGGYLQGALRGAMRATNNPAGSTIKTDRKDYLEQSSSQHLGEPPTLVPLYVSDRNYPSASSKYIFQLHRFPIFRRMLSPPGDYVLANQGAALSVTVPSIHSLCRSCRSLLFTHLRRRLNISKLFTLSDMHGMGRHPPHDSSQIKLSSGFASDVSESTLLQELIYCFQGINGKILKMNYASQGFQIDPKTSMFNMFTRFTRPYRKRGVFGGVQVQLKRQVHCQVMRLAELGWLCAQVQQHCQPAGVIRSTGLIGQSLVVALRGELTEYSRLVATLQSQLEPLASRRSNGLTLRQLVVWSLDPMARLKCLVAVMEACRDKKGGALASCIHSFLQHGDPFVKDTVKQLLAAVCKPLHAMLSRWILAGELDDTYGEFFIAANLEIKGNLLWHEKYRVLDAMVPSFISMAQAKKILATGKSINFLREVCLDQTLFKNKDHLKNSLESTSVETLFLMEREGELQATIDSAYLEASCRVKDVLIDKYNFLDHLQAMRKYLLLGQGDFIRYLMELLEPELKKPVTQLYPQNLSNILESAIRATNAQFEKRDILHRLDVRLLQSAVGDVGWDVFSLDYQTDGPIGTIFAPQSSLYLMLFNALWRAKRMEWILSGMWKRQVTSAKMLRKIPELAPLMKQMHLLTSEMVHFVHQMQYYILFEVLECSWDVLMRQVQQAESLDDIIRAHNSFLLTVRAGALLDDNSQLRAVYDLILQLQTHEEKLHDRAVSELQARLDRELEICHSEELKEFGTSDARDARDTARIKDFSERYLPGMRAQLRILAKSYQDVVKGFLLMLASQADVSLQLLSFRLDFNEHYKRHDVRLVTPLTYQHRRLSIMTGTAATRHK
uniref:Gamma-tubulin complex component n=1 Tax=Timema shepardi TaxID=629360 RepID=A0A7R9B2B8_TIMSH|nr:unnamed protein product [Timema shepardi]